ncbi:MAG: patatin-like phospholipase family protein [Acidimicrobiia bacterium]|nr:patatin-like phospholipase family protein [Acidimicrobiia bacterium]
MTRALVLGGGGPVGIAWETGLAVGLAEKGVRVATADRILGTSAGSAVGAALAGGQDMAALAERMYGVATAEAAAVAAAAPADPLPATEPAAHGNDDVMQTLMALMADTGSDDRTPEETRARLGEFALAQDTIPEDTFILFFTDLAAGDWPASFACTAVHAGTGEFVVWEQSHGVELQRAVASSCSVPGIFPPITIGEGRYIDGGMRSALNADQVVGADIAIVVSCMPLSIPGVDDPRLQRMEQAVRSELAVLTDSGAEVELVVPSDAFLEISGFGMFLMDGTRGAAAYQAGIDQGRDEAARLGEIWNR